MRIEGNAEDPRQTAPSLGVRRCRSRCDAGYDSAGRFLRQFYLRRMLASARQSRALNALTYTRFTLKRRLSAVGQAHRLKEAAWIPSQPLIRHALRSILRQHGRPTRKAAALATVDIEKLVATCDPGMTGQHDRAMISPQLRR